MVLRKLNRGVVGHRGEETVCLISDRGTGIIAAVADESNGWQPPFVVHRFCVRHIASNFNKVHKNQRCKNLVTYSAFQAQARKFEKSMELVQNIDQEAVEWFNQTDSNGHMILPKECWTLAIDGYCRFGYMTTNMAKTYNSVIKGARGLPVAALVKKIFYNCVMY